MTLKRLTQTICFSCGYELAGLAEHSVCPECGQDIAASLELRNFLDLNHKSLSEISAGLAATQIGYGLLSIALLYSVLSFLVTMPAPLSIILFSTLIAVYGVAVVSRFTLTKMVGGIFFSFYFAFVAYSLLHEFGKIPF